MLYISTVQTLTSSCCRKWLLPESSPYETFVVISKVNASEANFDAKVIAES